MGDGSGLTLPPFVECLDADLLLIDPETERIVTVSAGVSRLTGRSCEELRGLPFGEFLTAHADGEPPADAGRLDRATGGDPVTFDWQLERPSGELRWIRTHVAATTLDDTPCLVATLRDVTETHALTDRLRLYYRVLQHALRNEINLVSGYADLATQTTTDPETRDHLAQVQEAAETITSLSRSLEDVEAVTDRTAVTRTPMDVTELMRVAVETVRADHPAATIACDMPAAAWARVDDAMQVALEHLVENAVVHSETDAPRVEVAVADHPDDGVVEVMIRDDGPGIPEIEFESLGDLDDVSKVSHGSGFGLWVAFWCVDALGGTLDFETTPEGGTTARIRLPRLDRGKPADR